MDESMERREAEELVRGYVQAWVSRDLDQLLDTLSEDIEVIESDGSLYRGIHEVRTWFETWHADPIRGRVTRWTITRFLYDETEGVATAEWGFGCACYGVPAAFHGASIVTFSAGKIACIHECRREPMETPPDCRGHE